MASNTPALASAPAAPAEVSSNVLRQLIQTYIVGQLGDKAPNFDDPGLKIADLGLDSLGVVEMLFEVEDRFGFQVDAPQRYDAMSFNDMVADMEATVLDKNNGVMPTLKPDHV